MAFARKGESRVAVAGTVLFRRGEPSDGGVLILSGAILVAAKAHDAIRLSPGSLLGGTALLRGVRYNSSAVVAETATMFRLPRTARTGLSGRRFNAALPQPVLEA